MAQIMVTPYGIVKIINNIIKIIRMKIKSFWMVLCMGVLFASCNNETIQQPSGLEGEQFGNSIELTWNAVENAVSYDISRNGNYLATTKITRYTDNNPEDGENLYEVMAFDGQNYSKATSIRVVFNKPSDGDNHGGDDTPGGSENPGNGNETPEYYIKHPWGTGQDADWSWQQMQSQNNDTYIYDGYWGGVGANINTVDDDKDAKWFPVSSITGATGLFVGDEIRFTYKVSSSSLSISKLSTGGDTSADYYIKHPWGTGADADWSWQPMTKNGNRYEYTGAWGAKGANINNKPNDAGAYYYPLKNLNYELGAMIKFEYEPSTEYLYTTPVNNGGGGGTTTPNTPTGLKATASSSCIEVEWNSVSNADSYYVYRSTSSSSGYSKIKETNNTYYDDCSVNAGTTYYYKVSAVNSVGESSKSDYAYAKVSSSGGSGGGTTPPNTPTGLKATATTASIDLSWNDVSNATKYNVYRSTSASSGYSLLATAYSGYHSDYSANKGTTYYYKVSAENSAGESAKSSYVSATITSGGSGGGSTDKTKLDTPTNLSAYSSDNFVQITFDEVALCTTYDLYRSKSANSGYSKISSSGGSVSGGKYTLTDTNPISGTSYYKVKAVASSMVTQYYGLGDSDLSDYVKVTR